MPRLKVIPTNFEMFSGNTRLLEVTVLDQDDAVVDLTGAQAVDYSLAKAAGKAAIFEKTLGTGVTITDAVNGVLQITLLPADTEDLRGTFYQELEVTDAAGRITTVLFGTVTIRVNTT